MPFPKQSKLLWAVAAIACASGAAIAFYLKTLQAQVYQPLESGQLLPDETLMATFISPRPQALTQLRQFGTPETQAVIERGIKVFQQQSLVGTEFNFDRDLKPWMGGIMVALVPPKVPTKASDPNLLMIVGIKNKLQAWNFAKKFKTQPGIKQQVSQYRGIEITEYTEKSGKRYSVAILDDQVAIAAQKEPIQQAIDTFRGESSLASLKGTSEYFFESANVPNPIATLFIADYTPFIKEVGASLPYSTRLSLRTINQLEPIQTVVMSIGVDQEGLRVKTITEFRSQSQEANSSNPLQLGAMMDRFPEETIALINSQGIQQIWSQIVRLAAENPNVKKLVEQVRGGLGVINLDADQEVFGWMDGEFALGAIASDEGVLASLGLGGVLLIETSDRATAEQTLNKLDAMIAKSNPPVNVEERPIQGIEVTEWKDPKQGTLFGHGWLSSNLVFIAFGGPVVEVMATQPKQPLPHSPRFQRITTTLPQPNHSYIYLDMENLTAWATGYLFAAPASTLQPRTLTFLNSLQGIGLSATFLNPTTAQVEILLALKSKT